MGQSQQEIRTVARDRVLYVLYMATFLDLVAVSMMVTQLSNHLRDLGASHVTAGYIGSIYGLVQFLSSPVVGGFADQLGKRKLLLICITMCSIGYLMLGVVSSLWIIALLRVYLGIFKHPQNLIKSSLSDLSITGNVDRTMIQGYYETACSVAFIISPPLAGHIMELENGYAILGVIVSLLYLINSGILWFCLPDLGSNSHLKKAKESVPNDISRESRLQKFLHPLEGRGSKEALLILIITFLMGFSGMTYRTVYPILYREVFGLSHSQVGYVVSLNAMMQVFVGAAMKYISKILKTSYHQLLASCTLYATTLMMMSISTHHYSLLCLVLPLSTASMMGKVSSVRFTMDRTSKDHSATVIGITASIMSVARLVAPALSGMIIQQFGVVFPLYLTISSSLIAASLATLVNQMSKRKHKSE